MLDALHEADIPVLGRRQYLGLTVGASYCLGGATDDGIAIAVCEYASPEAAVAGKSFMESRFAVMTPTAKRAVRGATVITVVDAHEPRSRRVERALEVFAAISPQQTN